MEGPNTELMIRVYDAFDRADFDAIRALLDAEVE